MRFTFGRFAAAGLALLALTICYVPLAVYADVAASLPTVQHTPLPVGEYISTILAWGRNGTLVFLMGIASMYAPPVVRQWLTEKALGNALDYAIAVVDGATHGAVFDLRTSNAVLAEAERFMISHAPLVTKWLADTLKPYIIAYLSARTLLPPSSSLSTLDHSTVAERLSAVSS